MAITEVGAGSQRATDPTELNNADLATLAFPGDVTSGNLLIVTGSVFEETAELPLSAVVVTDTLSTVYTVILGPAKANGVGGSSHNFTAYGIAPSSGACTVTVNPEGATAYGTFSIDEFNSSIGWPADPLDVNGGHSEGNNTTPSDSITTGANPALIIGVMWPGTHLVAITPGADYTQIGEVESNSVHAGSRVFRIVTTPQAYSVNWTLGSSGIWAVHTASFKEAAAAPIPTPTPTFLLLGVGS